MSNDPNILKELRKISPVLTDLQGENVFKVPDNYFDTLSEKVLHSVTLKGLSSLSRDNVQQVPNGYFDNLSGVIINKIKSEEISDDDELQFCKSLIQNKRERGYKAPDGYFEGLPGKIFEKIHEENKAKVVPFFSRRIWKYTAAAAVAIGLLTGSYFTFYNHSNQNEFAVVNKNTVPYPAALKYNSTKAFNEGIASLSEDQIVDYLENHGNILDNDLLIKNTNVDELPNVDDYLINDQALNNYLEKINDNGNKKQ